MRVGDTVYLRSGSPKMTIVEADAVKDWWGVSWFIGVFAPDGLFTPDQERRSRFPEDALTGENPNNNL